MRAVLVTPTLPLPFGGADARWLHVVLGGLAARGHDVACLSCTEESSERVAAAADLAERLGFEFAHVPLRLDEGSVAQRRLQSLKTPFGEYARVAGLRAEVERLAAGADVVHLEHLFASRVGHDLDNSVTYLHHLEVIDWERRADLDLRERFVRNQMARATGQILKRTRRAMVATSRLASRVSTISPTTEVQIVPISLDIDLYPELAAPSGPVVGVIGSMHWYPSRSAAERVITRLWPQIGREVPEARLLVAGWGSDEYLGHHFPCPGAELLGEVASPEDYFGQISTLLYPPERGSGFKVKVLEAMAYGRPVVSNADGLEGLSDRGLAAAVMADTDAEFVAATVGLLRDPDRRRCLAQSGRKLIAEHYSPEPAVDRLLEAYERLGLIGKTGRRSFFHSEQRIGDGE